MDYLYKRVKLLTDAYHEDGAQIGDVGYIIEVHEPGVFEVEFSDSNGITLRMLVLRVGEVELYPE